MHIYIYIYSSISHHDNKNVRGAVRGARPGCTGQLGIDVAMYVYGCVAMSMRIGAAARCDISLFRSFVRSISKEVKINK